MKRILQHPVVAGTAAAASFAVISMWQSGSPLESFHRKPSAYYVIAGQTVTLDVTATRSKGGCSSAVERRWVDAAGNELAESVQRFPARPAGPERPFTVTLGIPIDAARGVLKLHTSVEFYCNPVQRLVGGTVVILEDVYFEVR